MRMAVLAVWATLSCAAPPCKSDLDCQFNGACTLYGTCKCDPGWTGAACEYLRAAPATHTGVAAIRNPVSSSWGGRAVRWADGLWHLYAVDLESCGLDQWRNSSRVLHHTSTAPGGPYVYRNVAIPTYAHNPDVVALPDGRLILFHIGNGSAFDSGASVANCSVTGNGTTPDPAHLAHQPARVPPKGFQPGTVHTASHPDGPWVASELLEKLKNGSTQKLDCNNPAPTALPNGTVLLWCAPCGGCYGECDCPKGEADCVCTGTGNGSFRLYSAASWGLPFQAIATEVRIPAELYKGDFKLDDPVLWADARGRLHVLHHNGQGPVPCGREDDVGLKYRSGNPYPLGCAAHLYSLDGREWRMSPVAASNASIAMADGTTLNVYRQRPKVVQSASGDITQLLNGVMLCARAPQGCLNGDGVGILGPYYNDYSWTSVVDLV